MIKFIHHLYFFNYWIRDLNFLHLCFLLIILLTACNYFEKQKVNSEDLLEEELQTFNWNEVDMYPRFSNCDSIIEKEESKICFQNTNFGMLKLKQ